jgi:hypothetical protein
MADFERRATIALDAETAFERLAEPAQLPLWLVGITLDDAVAVDGDPNLQDEGEAKPTAPAAPFVADRKARRVEWAAPSGAFSGVLEVQPMLAAMSAVVVRVHTRDAVDAKAAEAALDAAMKTLQRSLAG